MRYLLDTNALLFSWLDSASLSSRAREIIEASENELYYSQASVWEISLKHSIGKLNLPEPARVYLPACIRRMSLERAAMSDDILFQSTELEPHHKDPFDRVMIATAQEMAIPLLSRDRILSAYGVEVIW